MKRSLAFLLVLFFLIGCSSAYTQIPPLVTQTPTAEPTKTPTPEPTKDPRFSKLVPETLELCKQNNKVLTSYEAEDNAAILTKEYDLNIDFSQVPEFSIGIPIYNTKALKLPSIIGLNFSIKGNEKIIISSCTYKDLGGGKGQFRLGIPLRRTGHKEGGFFHFAMTPELTEKYFDIIGKPQLYGNNDIEKYYTEFAQKHKIITRGGINLILWRGYAEQGGIWDDLLNVAPPEINSKTTINDYLLKMNLFLGSRGTDPKTGKRVTIQEYGEEKLISELEKMILPAVSIGVIY